jgi:WD40 repeat protein
VNDVLFDPHGEWFATAGNDGKIILWSLPKAQELTILPQ